MPSQKHLFLLVALLYAAIPATAQRIDTRSLLAEMTDLNQLARPTDPAYTVNQFSSFDQRSRYPDYPGWFSNSDGFGGEPLPGFVQVLSPPGEDRIGEYLICDVQGPGAIVRLWTAHITGSVMLYLDGDPKPVYDGEAQKFFHHTYEAIAGTSVKENWAGSFFQNTAAYYPIPFEKSMKLIWKGDLATLHFYHVQVRNYSPATKVKTFSFADIGALSAEMDRISAILNHPEDHLDEALNEAGDYVLHLNPGETRKVMGLPQGGAIDRLAARLTAGDPNAGLRSTILEIRFDGAPWGQVQSPLGDFFGAAPGLNPYTSLPFTVHPDGWMVSRFLMPYRDSCEVLLTNKGEQEVTVNLKIAVTDPPGDPSPYYFRARWRVNHGLTGNPAAVFDLPYLLYRGEGKMVGAAAYLMNPTRVPSSYGNWWGEGDEKIFIDQEAEARFIGTGSEDYFNYAWSSSALFAHSYCGQPRNDGPANRGFVTNYRWHILDNVPFSAGLDFYMELYPHRLVEDMSYARMVYLYATRTGHDDHIPPGYADVRLPEMPASWWPKPDGWALNAIFYQVEDLVTSADDVLLERDYLWSDRDLALWQPEAAGDRLILHVPVTEDGHYLLAFTVRKSQGSGTLAFLLNGKPLVLNGSDQHDLNHDARPVSRNLKSGSLDLKAGLHEIAIVSKDPAALPVGLDFIWVKKNN